MTRIQWRSAYDRWLGPMLVCFCCLAVLACSVGVAIESHTNRVQDAQRLEDQKDRTAVIAHVTDCIRDFAAQLGENLPPVRKASTAQNDALMNYLVGPHSLGQLIIDAQRGITVDPKLELPRLVAAIHNLRVASRALDASKKANPYPKIPTNACQVNP